ncbi:MAG TPA: hypothetical protein VKD72_30780, partial [Gemmataceae bacterium]|nr:hypothetical protein [Gemmataceae bacterium]
TPEARERLRGAEPLALGLELVVFGAFLASLGDGLSAVLQTVRGNVLIFGTLIFAVLVPLLIHGRIGERRPWGLPATAVSVLIGGLIMRYGTVTTPGEILRRGPSVAASYAPEGHRHRGESGADIHNYGNTIRPRSKLPVNQ